MAEHQVIGRAISGLKDLGRALEAGKNVPAELLGDEIDFIRNFTDRCHHKKEEKVLFPALEDKALTVAQELVQQLVREHDEGRALTQALAQGVESYSSGETGQRARIASLAKELSELYFRHIRTENTELAQMVEKALPADKKLEVAERFSAIEDELGPEYHKKYELLANKLRQEGRGLAA